MIPVRLSLRNFMCYRDVAEVLDLTSIHIACLSGENGAGKSALLEALTWSLWGKARDRFIDDELISKGASEMEVDYHFLLNGQHYRVMRKRARKGNSGTTILDLQVSPDGEDGTWRNISGATVRDTQARITELLKIDYDTFINSAFILQGRADEFTVKNPADRKRVLADILGLSQYDQLEERAKEEARERKSRMMELEATVRHIDVELLKRPGYAQELEEVESQLLEAQEGLANLRAELAEVQSTHESLKHSSARLNELRDRAHKREAAMLTVKTRINQYVARKEQLEGLLAQRAEIEQGYADWHAALAEERRFNDVIAALRTLEGKRARFDQAIHGEKAALERDVANHRRIIRDLETRLAGRDTVTQQLADAVDQVRQLDQLQIQYEDIRCQRENLDVRHRTLTTEIDTLKDEGDQLRQKLDMIMRAHAQGNGHAGCPLCGTDLSAEALERVRQSFDADITAKRLDYKRKRDERDTIKAEIVTIVKRLGDHDARIKDLGGARQREAQRREALKSLDEAEQTLARENKLLAQVQARLDANDYAHEARQGQAEVAAEMARLSYDEAAHDAAVRKVVELRPKDYERLYHELQGASQALASVLERLEADNQGLETSITEQEQDHTEIAALTPQVATLESVTRLLEEKQRDEGQLANRAASLGESRGGLRNKLLHCDTLQEEKGRYMAAFQVANEEKSIYDELALAFGKKGIQAMIIENVIPEIEDATNTMLNRMTDGRMSVQFATQRDAKSGKSVIETLDINISDEIGTRAYEMYSGGEAFRVNFAMRIALSKLLARRAGTQLQTLVIDEGFGSQDGQGREKLVGAIRSIEGDFEKILVITHIEELRDEFPARINIVKTGTGSRIIMGESFD
jgi:exonuclease SbcC